MSKDGLAIYIIDTLNYKIREDLSKHAEGIFESLFIEVYTSSREVIIVGEVHIPPSGSSLLFFQVFNEVILSMHQQPCEIILMGDFTINFLKNNNSVSADFP